MKIFAAEAKLAKLARGQLHRNVYSPPRHLQARRAKIIPDFIDLCHPQLLETIFCFYFIPHSALTTLLSGKENPCASVPVEEPSCTKRWLLSSPDFVFLT